MWPDVSCSGPKSVAPRYPRGGLISQGQPEHRDPLSGVAKVDPSQENLAWHPGELPILAYPLVSGSGDADVSQGTHTVHIF